MTAGGVRAIAIKADSANEAELRDAVAKTCSSSVASTSSWSMPAC
jgi:hypothetical protein